MKNIKYHHDHDQLGDPAGEDRDGDLLHPVHALHHQGHNRIFGTDRWYHGAPMMICYYDHGVK